MRIFHRKTNQLFNSMEIFLTLEEANEVLASLQWLVENHDKGDAFHLDSELKENKYRKELTVTVYTKNNQDHFDERTKKLINEDK